MKILLKKAQTHKKLNYGRHPMLRFYEKHNLASKSFLLNKETQVDFFLWSCVWKSKCDCWCLHFWHNCCFFESSVSLILITMSLPKKQPSFEEPLSSIGRMQLGLAALFVTPSHHIYKRFNWRCMFVVCCMLCTVNMGL